MSGYLSDCTKIAAFSADMRSLGSPWLFHSAIWASSQIISNGSTPSVEGIGGFKKHFYTNGYTLILKGVLT